jgi:hypothetical protein
MDTAIQVTSLIGTLSTIILGVTAISLALYFFRESHRLHTSLSEILLRIRESSTATDVRTKEVLDPVLKAILGLVRDSTRSRVEDLSHLFMQRSAAKLDKVLKAETDEEKGAARREFIDELNALLGTLKHEVGKVGLALDSERTPIIEEEAEPPGSSSYNWTPFIRRIRDLQASHRFLAVKWLRETKFSDDPEAQEALQVAIDRSMLATYYRDNPKKPQFPTLCCKLDQDHPVVGQSLQAIAEDTEALDV